MCFRERGWWQEGAWNEDTLTEIPVRDAGSWTDAEAVGMERWGKMLEKIKPGDTCRE